MSDPTPEKPVDPRDLYYWLKIAFLIIGTLYLAGKVFGKFLYNLGV